MVTHEQVHFNLDWDDIMKLVAERKTSHLASYQIQNLLNS